MNVSTTNINPFFITGFANAEGCFLFRIRQNNKSKVGYSVEVIFQISLHEKIESY